MGADVDAFQIAGDQFRYASDVPELVEVFSAVAEAIRLSVCNVDSGLYEGGLVCCAHVYTNRFGDDEVPPGPWFPPDVKRLAAAAVWPDEAGLSPDVRWYHVCARRFLDTCAAHNLGIWWS